MRREKNDVSKRDPLRKNARSVRQFEEKELSKEYYKIQEVANIIGVPASTIRFWETLFEEIQPVRSIGNVRYYTPEIIRKIRMIYFLVKVKGMRIESAKEQLRTNRHNISRRLDAIEGLEEIRDELKSILQSMGKRR